MRKRRFLPFLFILSLLLCMTACEKKKYSKNTIENAKRNMEIVYKRGQTCYAIDPDNEGGALYVFSAAGQPVFDKNDSPTSSVNLIPGMVVEVDYDGYIMESYPSQFSGINKISIRENRANNVDFLVSQISGMFPSTQPDGNDSWKIEFAGSPYLSDVEKQALEYILRENWTGATVTVQPKEVPDKGAGTIRIDFQSVDEDSMSLEIVVNDGSEGAVSDSKLIHAQLSSGTWEII